MNDQNRAHLKSTPSRSYWETVFMTALAKAMRFASVATAEEKYSEPPHPPTESMAKTPWNYCESGKAKKGQ